jgi:membrane-anchored mycosin MYCP
MSIAGEQLVMPTARTTRVFVVTLVAAASVFLPGSAGAQPSSSAPPTDNGMATPPPLAPDVPPPKDDGAPSHEYALATPCVRSRPSAEPLRHKPWGQDLLRFTELPQFATGAGQKVAVIDTGVTPHAYLGDRLEGVGDYVVPAENGLKDCDGHGTEVAGIIAANPGTTDIGFRGIAPEAGIVSIRQSSGNYEYSDDEGQKHGAGDLPTLAKAIVRAADTPGVTVINMSVNHCRPVSEGPIKPAELELQAALRYAVVVRDVVVVSSAGNQPEPACPTQNGPDPKNPTVLVMPPWFSDYVLSVAAVDANGDPAEFSIQGPWVSVAAPGTEITSLDPVDPAALANQSLDDKGQAHPIQGTSFAAPYVSGLVALVRDRFEDLTAKQVMTRIMTTAAHPAATGGRDTLVGHGMINPVAALTAFIPAEKNLPPDEAVATPFTMPPIYERDWSPMRVAMIGSGGGVGLLLLTLFVMHTVRRNRRLLEDSRPARRTP